MTGEPILTVTGNLTNDPEMRTTKGGTPVINYTVAATPRQFKNGEWSDGETLFQKCAQWQGIENAAQTLQKGMRVVVTGQLKSHSWQDTTSGANRSEHVLEVQEVGVSLKHAIAQVRKTTTGGQQQNNQPQQNYNPQPGAQNPNANGWGNQQAQPQQDPWANTAQRQQDPWAQSNQQSNNWGNGSYTEPPF